MAIHEMKQLEFTAHVEGIVEGQNDKGRPNGSFAIKVVILNNGRITRTKLPIRPGDAAMWGALVGKRGRLTLEVIPDAEAQQAMAEAGA